jgi:hypothetical protein
MATVIRIYDKNGWRIEGYYKEGSPTPVRLEEATRGEGDLSKGIAEQQVRELSKLFPEYSFQLVDMWWESDRDAGQPQWVPVSERLPGFNAWYLISYGAYVHEAYFWTATKDWSYNRPPESDRREVIEPPVAWMPLPKPYTPGGKCYPTALDAFRELQEADQ